MNKVMTIIASSRNDDIDDAGQLAVGLVEQGILVKFSDGLPFRPVMVMGEDAIEVCCPSENWKMARATFKEAGFGFPGDE